MSSSKHPFRISDDVITILEPFGISKSNIVFLLLLLFFFSFTLLPLTLCLNTSKKKQSWWGHEQAVEEIVKYSAQHTIQVCVLDECHSDTSQKSNNSPPCSAKRNECLYLEHLASYTNTWHHASIFVFLPERIFD